MRKVTYLPGTHVHITHTRSPPFLIESAGSCCRKKLSLKSNVPETHFLNKQQNPSTLQSMATHLTVTLTSTSSNVNHCFFLKLQVCIARVFLKPKGQIPALLLLVTLYL